MIKLGIDAPSDSRTAQVVQLLESDIEIQTLWYMANRTSRRAAVNDHGPVHVRTAMHHGDMLLRIRQRAEEEELERLAILATHLPPER